MNWQPQIGSNTLGQSYLELDMWALVDSAEKTARAPSGLFDGDCRECLLAQRQTNLAATDDRTLANHRKPLTACGLIETNGPFDLWARAGRPAPRR